ncbi:MAG TPA: hypothetical protein DCR93_33440 [Cytophagales bacterium]|nr:hypothetical protein [Cytophagales bacterium]
MKFKHSSLILGVFGLAAVAGCEDPVTEFDIDWPVPVIESFSPQRDTVENQLTIVGQHFSKIAAIRIGGTRVAEDNIVSQSETELVVQIPRVLTAGPIEVENLYEKVAMSEGSFTPIYPPTTVGSFPVSFPSGSRFKVAGENMDFVNRVTVNGTDALIATATSTQLVVDTKDLVLVVGEEVSVQLFAYGDISNAVGTIMVDEVQTLPPGSNPVFLGDFEDGSNRFTAWTGSPLAGRPESQVNGGNGVSVYENGGGSFYQSVTIADITDISGWGPYFGEVYFGDKTGIAGLDTIDVSQFRDPHVSFLVNTGSNAAQFAMEIYESEKFANWSDLIATNGEWQWVSLPFGPEINLQQWGSNGWDADAADGELDYSAIRYVQLGMGVASVADNGFASWEANIDRVMITDGPVNSPANGDVPTVSVLWDFEDGVNDWVPGTWQSDVSSSAQINGGDATAPNGSNFLQVTADVASGGWNWYGNLEKSVSVDLGEYLNPHISFYVNNYGKDQQFEAQIFDALGGSWGTNFVAPAYDGWQIITLNLNTASWGNWGAETDAPDLSGLTLFKLGFNSNFASDGETVEIGVDYLVVTDGRIEMIAPPKMTDHIVEVADF